MNMHENRINQMKTALHKPENFFLVFAILGGLISIIFIPFGAGYDEDTHIARIWEISSGNLIPNSLLSKGGQFPYAFYEISYRQQPNLDTITQNYWRMVFNKKIDWSIMIEHQTRSFYLPTTYILQGIIMGITGRYFDFSIGWIYLLLRFSYLISYILLTYIAIKIIPFGKWLIFIVALSPMAILQASSVNPEGLMNGIVFLFIAFLVKYKKLDRKFNKYDFLLLGIFLLGIASLKPNMLTIMLLLFILPKDKFRNKSNYFLTIFLGFLFVLLLNLAWFGKIGTIEPIINSEKDINAIAQIRNILKSPINYLSITINTIKENTLNYYLEWVGVFGYRYGNLSKLVYFLYPITMLFIVISESSRIEFTKRQKWIIFFSVFAYITTTFLLIYLIGNSVNSSVVDGIQGRYFTSISLAILLLISSMVSKRITISPLFFIILSSLEVILFVISIFFNYYYTCGFSYLNFSDCILPRYKNWPPEQGLILEVNNKDEFIQEIKPDCEKIKEMDIYFGDSINNQKKSLVIDLINKESDQKIYSDNFNLSHVENGWLKIIFQETLDVDKDGLLMLKINTDNNNALQIPITKNDEYQKGNLYYLNNTMPYDVIFKYVCGKN